MADPLLDRIKNVFVPKDSAPPPSAKTTEDDTEFDEEGFKEAAKSLGTFSEKEIDEYVKREKIGLKSPIAEPKAEDVEIKDPFKEFEGVAKAGAGYLGYKLGRALIPNRPDDNIPPPPPPPPPPNNPPDNKNQSLDDIKRQNLINQERRAQELHDLEIQLKQNKLSTPTAQAKPIQDRTIGGAKTITDPMLTPEIQQSTGFTGLTDLEKQTGGPITTGSDLKMIQQSEQNRLAKEAEAKLAEAKLAGVTPVMSEPESQTLVTTKANAQTPEEKLNQAVDIVDSIKPSTTTKEGVPVPEGRIPNYMEFKTKKGGAKEFKNKQGSDVIGKGGYNWYQGQMGPEAETNWLHQFGRTNQSYADVVQAIKEGRLKGPAVNEIGRGGSFPREATVPNFIKGNASLGVMASTGLTAALLALAGSEKGQEAMAKASKAIKDLGVSPDIFTNKAEELGNLGSSYVTAGNPSYQRELMQKLNSTKNPEYRNFLMQELQKLPTSGSGIAPPMR
jgi:hypothetical protein